MNKHIEVMVIVEGMTEEIFIKSLLSPYLGEKNISMHATQVTKPGQKGGDVRFFRVKKDLGTHLKQRHDTYVTTLVDYYGTREWPGLENIPQNSSPAEIAQIINEATKKKVMAEFSDYQAENRFIPYMAIHEFESLLFSDVSTIADKLHISKKLVEEVIRTCGEPEAINNSPETAPSKRLAELAEGNFSKTTTGIDIAKATGIKVMREKCPIFNEWIKRIESKQRFSC